jgi:hypothetical protein
MGFSLSERTRVSLTLNYQKITNEVSNTTSYSFFDNNQQATGENVRNFFSDFEDEIVEFQLDLNHSFEKEGQELRAYITRSMDTESYRNAISNTEIGFTDESYNEDNKIENTVVDVQYSQPIGEASSFVIGYNGEMGKIPFRYSGQTNQEIDYSRDVHALFLDFEQEYDKVYFSVGMRTEISDTQVDYRGSQTDYQEDRTDWFPSAYLELSLGDKSSLSMSYGRKLIEPGYYQLNPVEQRYSETSLYRGNDNLKPVFVDMSTLNFNYYSNNFTFSPGLFYNNYHDYWQEITYATGTVINSINTMLTKPVNLGTVNYYGLNITAINKLSDQISLTSNALFFLFDQSGIYNGLNDAGQAVVRDYNHDSTSGTLSMMAQFRFPEVINIQTTVKHELASEGAYSERDAYTYMSLVLSKDLFNNNATLSVTANDLFNSVKTDRKRFDPDYLSDRLLEKEFRTVLVSFTYRFNQSKKERDIDFDKKVNTPKF